MPRVRWARTRVNSHCHLPTKQTPKNQPSSSAPPPPPPPFCLDVVHGPAADAQVRGPPGAARMILGRKKGPATALHVPDDTVSERHAVVEWEARPVSVGGGRYTLTDLGSTNGTRLNGEEVVGNGPAHDLSEGDVLHLGKGTVAVVTVKEGMERDGWVCLERDLHRHLPSPPLPQQKTHTHPQLPTPMVPGQTVAQYVNAEFARLAAHAHKRTAVVEGLLKERVASSVATLRRVGAEAVAAKRAAAA